MSEAYESWPLVNIPEVLFFQEGPGVRKWQFRDAGVKLLNVGNINKGKVDLSTTKLYLSEEEANGKYAHFLLDEGDLIIACSGIVLENFHNKISFVEEKHLPLCLNTSTMRFKPLDNYKVDINFFRYFLQTTHFNKQLRKLITGSAQLNFGPSHIKKIKIPLPSLAEQKQIAAILDAADNLRQKDQQLVEHYTQLSQSLFLDMFGDPVTNSMGWDIIKLDEVADISSGVTKGRKIKSGDIIEIPYMRVANVQDGHLKLEEIKTIPGTKADIEKYGLKLGDVLLTEGGDPDKLGRGAVWNNEIETCIHQNHIFKVRLTSKMFIPIYLNKLSGSEYGKRYFLKSGKQTTGIASINKTQLKRFPVQCPPIQLQNQFAERIEKIEQQKQQARANLAKSNDLFNALLQKAFTGELTANKAA